MLNRLSGPLLVAAGIMLALAPVMVARAPYESTMGLVQKIFYFHVPAWLVMFVSVFVCGIAGAVALFRNRPAADRLAVAAAELAVLFGLIGLVTGPLWARKSWGAWWVWDAKLTTALVLWMIFVSYLLLRRYGGPGAAKLSAAVALFGMANVPFVYWAANLWRTVHPQPTVVPTLGPGMREAFWWCAVAFVLLYLPMLAARARLEHQRAALDELYLLQDEE